jgi:hypothetical protein
MLSTEAAGLALSIAMGLVKLTRKVDLMLAEKEAVTSPVPLPAPELNLEPFPEDMERALAELVSEPYREDLDPIAADREEIENLLKPGADPSSEQMFPFIKKYLPGMEIRRSIDLNSEFMRTLRRARPDWASDQELRVAAFYVHAGNDYRNKGYCWRLALTVADVVAEFGAENTALFVRDKNLQGIVGAVLKRFGETDAQTTDSTRDLLRCVLSATLNGAIGAKEYLHIDNDWMEALVEAMAAARSKASDPDNFLMGLVQGRGYPLLVGSVMATASGQLGAGDVDAFELAAASFLKSVAGIVEAHATFDDFFKDHWGDLMRAGLRSVATHGPALLADEEPLLGKILSAVAGNLSSRPDNKFLTREALFGIVETVMGTVAAHPDRIDNILSDGWLSALIHSVAGIMSDEGVLKAFTREGLEAMAKKVLHTFGAQPDLIIQDPGLAGRLLGGVLSSISKVSVFNVESLASATVTEALGTLSDHPDLVKFDYGDMVADLAGKITTLVKEKRITNIQGQEMVRAAISSLAQNPSLLIDRQKKLAAVTIDAVIDIAGQDAGPFISGQLMSDILAGVLYAVAVTGKGAIGTSSGGEFEQGLKDLLRAGMVRAEAWVGVRMGLQSLPQVLELLVMAWAHGEIETIDPQDQAFINIFELLADLSQGSARI